MTFHIGQKVVCIVEFMASRIKYPWIIFPIKDGIYTVRGKEFRGEWPAIVLKEIKNPMIEHDNGVFAETAFADDQFRPLVTTDISIFTAMLAPKKVDA